jgi:hypothetical protein
MPIGTEPQTEPPAPVGTKPRTNKPMSSIVGPTHLVDAHRRDARTANIYAKYYLDTSHLPKFVEYAANSRCRNLIYLASCTVMRVQGLALFANSRGDDTSCADLASQMKAVIQCYEKVSAHSVHVVARKERGYVECTVYSMGKLSQFLGAVEGGTKAAKGFRLPVLLDRGGFWMAESEEQRAAMHTYVHAMQALPKGKNDPTIMSIDDRIYLTCRMPSNLLTVEVILRHSELIVNHSKIHTKQSWPRRGV